MNHSAHRGTASAIVSILLLVLVAGALLTATPATYAGTGAWALDAAPDPAARAAWVADRLMSPLTGADATALPPAPPSEQTYRIAFLGSGLGSLFGQAALGAAPTLVYPPAPYNVSGASPNDGDADPTTVTFRVTYTDTDGDVPVTPYLYLFQGDTVTPYGTSPYTMSLISGFPAGGATYSVTLTLTSPIRYFFYFQFTNAADPAVRLPAGTAFNSILVNRPPTLTGASCAPAEGGNADSFTFDVTYTELDNQPPADQDGLGNPIVLLHVTNTTANPDVVYNFAMQAVGGGSNWTGGQAFSATVTGLSIGGGDHTYWMEASDSIDVVKAPATAPDPSFAGPHVNDPPNPVTSGFSPFGGAIVPQTTTPLVSWDPGSDPNNTDTPNTLRYRVEFSRESGGNFSVQQAATTAANDTTLNPADYGIASLGPGLWYYRIVTLDDDDEESAPSAEQSFRINSAPVLSTAAVDPTGPDPVTYLGAGEGDNFTFSVTYTDVDNNPAASINVVVQRGGDTYNFALTDTGGAGALNDGNYVNGENYQVTVTGAQIGDGSHTFYFTANDGIEDAVNHPTPEPFPGPEVNDAPNAVTSGFNPASGSTVHLTPPQITWDATTDPNSSDPPNTLSYRVELSRFSNNWAAPEYTYLSAPGVTQVDVTTPLTNTKWYYRVVAIDDWGAETPSTVQDFTVVDVAPVLSLIAAPFNDGVDPNAGGQDDPYTFKVRYRDNDNDAPAPIEVVVTNTTTSTTTTHTMVFDVFNGTPNYAAGEVFKAELSGVDIGDGEHLFYFRASDGQTTVRLPAGAPATQFEGPTLNDPPNPPLSGFDPRNGEVVPVMRPDIVWNPGTDPNATDVPATLRYRVEFSATNAPFTVDPTYTATSAVGATTAAPAADLADGLWYYRVITIDDLDAESIPSAVQNFVVDFPNSPPNTPVPAAAYLPADGALIGTTIPLFDWPDGTDPDPLDPPATLRYDLQVDDDANFSSPVIDITTDAGVSQYQTQVAQALVGNAQYYWRVRTRDDEDAVSAWTDPTLTFTTSLESSLRNGAVTPLFGEVGTNFLFTVEFVDTNDLPPAGPVQVVIGPGALLTRNLTRDVTDTDPFSAGVTYRVTIPGSSLGIGTYNHFFRVNTGDPLNPVVTATDPGPIIGVVGTVRFTNNAWVTVAGYEEGARVYVEVNDADENKNPGAAEQITVRLTDANLGDTENVTLTETGNNTGVFRGSINTLGRAGSSFNGTLNVNSTAAGDLITARWWDPDEQSIGQPPVTTTALVTDTVAPPALAAGQLTAASGPDGITVDLDWSAYDEAAAIDVAGYHVWQRTSAFGNTALATQIADLPAGTQTFEATGLTVGVQYWFAVTPYDEVPNENATVNTTSVTTVDSVVPVFANLMPAPGAVEVALDTNISFDVLDDGAGVDPARIRASVNGASVTADLQITPIPGGFNALYDPPADFDWNQQVTVVARAFDLSNGEASTTWQFSTVTDITPPQVVNKQFSTSPARVSFDITDDVSGVDVSTLVFEVDGVDVTASATVDATDPMDVHVVYQPAAPWPFNTTAQFSVDVADNAGNAAATDTWTENGPTDANAPLLDQFVPTNGAGNVSINTTISFRARDAASGLDASSLVMTVNGQDVSADLVTNIIAAAGDASELTATYTPPVPLDYSTQYDVHIEAADTVGNRGSADWSFTTAAEPTWEITGVVTDANGDPLPGVDVAAGGTTVGTDGNGVYRITGLVAGTYTVTPSLAEYDFAPVSQEVTLGPNARDVNFVGTARTYQINGRVVGGSGQGVEGVEVSDGTRTALTDANGNYTITNVPGGLYTVTCSRDGNNDGFEDFTYTPTSRTVNVTGSNVVGVNFTATGQTYTVTGTISDTSGRRVAGVTVSDGVRSAVTNEAGQFTIGGVPPGTATLTPTKAGMAFDPATRQVTVPPSSTGQNFIAYVEFVHRFPAGLGLVAVPALPPASQDRAVDVFGTAQVARWDPTAVPPTYVSGVNDPDHVELTVRPGAGFFVNFPAATTVRVPGDGVSGTGTFSVGVTSGWNMLGNMYETALPMANITAAGSTRIRPFAFVYDSAIGGYRMVSSSPAFNAARNFLEVWEGAWFRAIGPSGTLNIQAPSGVAATALVTGAAAQAEVPEGGWLIPIEARAAGRADVTTVAGVGSGPEAEGYRVENPPQVPGSVDVYFTGAGGELLAHDIRPAGAGPMVWTFAVACDLPETEVELTLPDLSAVPADLAVYLTDEDSGQRMYARTLPAYRFMTDADGGVRHFALEVAPRGADNLAIRSAAAHSNGAGLMVTCDLSAACNVSIEVLNVAGRVVRTLVADRAVPAGQTTQMWDLRSAAGTVVPAGTYLIKIEAVAENGQRVQALRSAQITR